MLLLLLNTTQKMMTLFAGWLRQLDFRISIERERSFCNLSSASSIAGVRIFKSFWPVPMQHPNSLHRVVASPMYKGSPRYDCVQVASDAIDAIVYRVTLRPDFSSPNYFCVICNALLILLFGYLATNMRRYCDQVIEFKLC